MLTLLCPLTPPSIPTSSSELAWPTSLATPTNVGNQVVAKKLVFDSDGWTIDSSGRVRYGADNYGRFAALRRTESDLGGA